MRGYRHPRLADVELADVMRALADPVRVEIVGKLARAKRPLTCAEIRCDRPKSSMSHHFRILRDCGVIETRVTGKEHFNLLRGKELEQRFPGLARVLFRLALGEPRAARAR